MIKEGNLAINSIVNIVDDDTLIHKWLAAVLKSNGLQFQCYDCAAKFMKDFDPSTPGCILLDLKMPEINGLELQKHLQTEGNKSPIIFLTGTADVSSAVKALKNGAFDFLEKPLEKNTLLNVVTKALDQDLRQRYEGLEKTQVKRQLSQLTKREEEVLNWLVKGKPNKTIAQMLNISIRTVEVHRKNIMEKTEAGSLANLVKMALDTN